jgi:hypothetical protein
MNATSPVRTEEEIDALKANWLSDPCWDIEHTEGFEAHAAELRAFRLQLEAEEEAEQKARIAARAAAFGCTEHLLQYIESLENRIWWLERKVNA